MGTGLLIKQSEQKELRYCITNEAPVMLQIPMFPLFNLCLP